MHSNNMMQSGIRSLSSPRVGNELSLFCREERLISYYARILFQLPASEFKFYWFVGLTISQSEADQFACFDYL